MVTFRHENAAEGRDIPSWAFTIIVVLCIALAAGLAWRAVGTASARPHDAPQTSDVSWLMQKEADCYNGFTSVMGRNASNRTAVFALERKFDDVWLPASTDNDGARAYIDSILYEGRAVVTVRPGQLFEIEHHQHRGDSGAYRLMAMWTGGPTARNVLISPWVSHRPIESCRQL